MAVARGRGSPPGSRSAAPTTRATCRAGSAAMVLADRTGAARADRPAAREARRRRPHRGRAQRRPGARPRPPSPTCVGDPRARHRGGLRAAGQPRPAADAPRERVAAVPDRGRRLARRRRVRVGARRVRHRGGERRPEPARAAGRRARARARGRVRVACTTCSTRRAASTRRWRRRRKFGQEIAAELREAKVGAVDPHRHLRHRHALRGNAGEGVRARGHPDRVRDRAADDRADGGGEPHPAGRRDHHPTGDPSLAAGDERAMRVRPRAPGARDARAPRSSPATIWELDVTTRRAAVVVGLVRARACARPGPLRVEARRGSRRPPRRARRRALRPSTTRSRTRRTRCSSATSRPSDAVGHAPRDWWRPSGRRGEPAGPVRRRHGPSRVLELLAEVDRFDLVRMGAEPRDRASSPCTMRRPTSSAPSPATTSSDESLSAQRAAGEPRRSRRAACTRSGICSTRTGVDPASITHAIGCGEEAVGDRYQRGGGNVAKAIAEECGLARASGIDVKSFCAAPVHALVVAAALIEAGIEERGRRRGGGFARQARHEVRGCAHEGVPVLEDVLAGMAVLLEPADGSNGPIVRTDAVGPDAGGGRVGAPGAARGAGRRAARRPRHRRSATSTPTRPRSTTPRSPSRRAAATSPTATTRCWPASAWCAGELERDDIPGSPAPTACPGFSPTQGHIASAVPWLPHALARMRGRRPAPNDVDRQGLAVPRAAHAPVGRRVRDVGGLTRGGPTDDRSHRRDVRRARRQGEVLVDIWGPQCQPCLALMPAVEALARDLRRSRPLREGERPRQPEGLPRPAGRRAARVPHDARRRRGRAADGQRHDARADRGGDRPADERRAGGGPAGARSI